MALKLVRRRGSKIWYVSGTIRGNRYFESTRTGSREHAEAYCVRREREILDAEFFGATIFAEAVLVYLEKGGDGTYLAPLIDRFGPLHPHSRLHVKSDSFDIQESNRICDAYPLAACCRLEGRARQVPRAAFVVFEMRDAGRSLHRWLQSLLPRP